MKKRISIYIPVDDEDAAAFEKLTEEEKQSIQDAVVKLMNESLGKKVSIKERDENRNKTFIRLDE
ncbi:MAG TPA: hypothetical protein VJ987_04795 [Anaerolineales bacterium]|nr:hypothetical protein [Anaerolineales bacterium]